MTSNFIRKFSLLIITLSIALLPLAALAEYIETQGTLKISIVDENGQPFSGNWNLHNGTSTNSAVIRNGTSSESFKADPGLYYLEVINVLPDYKYFLLDFENPQEVVLNETTDLNVQYFDTEEAYLAATSVEEDASEPEPTSEPTPEPTPTSTTTPTTVDGDIYDENGCNRTVGYVWCDRTQKCTMPWTKACVVSTADEPIEETKPVEPPPPIQVISKADLAERTYMGEPTTNMFTEDTATSSAAATAATTDNFELAQTGPANALLLLIPIMLSGLYYVRRKKI